MNRRRQPKWRPPPRPRSPVRRPRGRRSPLPVSRRGDRLVRPVAPHRRRRARPIRRHRRHPPLATGTRRTVGVEIEPKWAASHPATVVGDASRRSPSVTKASTPWRPRRPTGTGWPTATTGATARGGTRTGSPSAATSTARNGAALQWGQPYRLLHIRAIVEMVRVVEAGRAGARQRQGPRSPRRARRCRWLVVGLAASRRRPIRAPRSMWTRAAGPTSTSTPPRPRSCSFTRSHRD